MTDNEITREKTFSEELPYFRERIKEIFDNYDNPNGYEDPLYIAVLRDSHRIVRKAEEEINRQKLEIERLESELSNTRRKALLEASSKFAGHSNYHGDTILCKLICMAEGKEVGIATPLDMSEMKAEAYKEFAERLKNEIINDTAYAYDSTQHSGYYDYQIKIGDIPEYIDNLVKEMMGEEE